MNIYTYEERMVHKYTVGQAIDIAKEVLRANGLSDKVYMPPYHTNINASCTMEDLNNIKDLILSETSYWSIR
jgi:hypothetical protein